MCAVFYADPSLSWRTDKYHQWVTQRIDQLPQNHSATDLTINTSKRGSCTLLKFRRLPKVCLKCYTLDTHTLSVDVTKANALPGLREGRAPGCVTWLRGCGCLLHSCDQELLTVKRLTVILSVRGVIASRLVIVYEWRRWNCKFVYNRLRPKP